MKTITIQQTDVDLIGMINTVELDICNQSINKIESAIKQFKLGITGTETLQGKLLLIVKQANHKLFNATGRIETLIN